MEGGLERDEEKKGRGNHGQLPKGAHAPADTAGPTETTGETWLVSGHVYPRSEARSERRTPRIFGVSISSSF